MKWYLSKIVFRIHCGDGLHTPQYEEQLRLIAAADKEEAFDKSKLIGVREEESFFNLKQQLIRWQFINVSEIYPLDKMIDGAEVYSRVTEEESAEDYEYVINKKSQNIFSHDIAAWLQPA